MRIMCDGQFSQFKDVLSLQNPRFKEYSDRRSLTSECDIKWFHLGPRICVRFALGEYWPSNEYSPSNPYDNTLVIGNSGSLSLVQVKNVYGLTNL